MEHFFVAKSCPGEYRLEKKGNCYVLEGCVWGSSSMETMAPPVSMDEELIGK